MIIENIISNRKGRVSMVRGMILTFTAEEREIFIEWLTDYLSTINEK